MSERLERPERGAEFTNMVATGPVVPGVPVPVVGTTVTGEDVQQWTGCLVVPVEDKEKTDD
jgi:hypothetical protein